MILNFVAQRFSSASFSGMIWRTNRQGHSCPASITHNETQYHDIVKGILCFSVPVNISLQYIIDIMNIVYLILTLYLTSTIMHS